MSKSLDNYIGIAESPVDMYGKCMSIPDGIMGQYYTLLTDVPETEIADIQRRIVEGTLHPMAAKKRLALLVTERFHGSTEAAAAQANFEAVFSRRVSTASADIAYEDVPLPGDLSGQADVGVVDLLFMVGAAASKSELRRLVQQGGIEVNGERIADIGFRVSLRDLPLRMRVGKKRFLSVNRE
jgi:tyrosyl-tRNA synthetase